MSSKKEKLIFLIPVLNEAEAIQNTIDTIKDLKIKKLDYEIIIVDGGSTDGTLDILKKNKIKVIKSKKGYGRQYKLALSKIKGDYIITGDADCTYPFDQAYHYLKKYVLTKKYDFINTNRFARSEKGSMSFSHFLGNSILTITTNFFFNLRFKDSQSGMWIFRKSVLNKLTLTDDDMAFSEEIKIEAFKKLKKVKELPISYYERVGDSKLNYGHAFKNQFFIFKKRFTFRK